VEIWRAAPDSRKPESIEEGSHLKADQLLPGIHFKFAGIET